MNMEIISKERNTIQVLPWVITKLGKYYIIYKKILKLCFSYVSINGHNSSFTLLLNKSVISCQFL